ncbi:MAG: IMP dehydrogenase [bacterium]|nr:IMP dehydrogenase [bacterium]
MSPRHSQQNLVSAYMRKKGLPRHIGLTFEDVTIVPRFSRISHRSDEFIDTGTNFGKGVTMRRPIFSANMDTITESRMAIALARLGGCGAIHQFLPISQRVSEVGRVKRADNLVVQTPLTVELGATIKDARILTEEYQISGLIVVDEQGKVAGILSQRDVRWAPDNAEVRDRMTPFAQLTVASPDVSIEEAKRILYEKRIEKLPLLSESRRCVGLITASDILKVERYKYAFRDAKGRLGVGASVGIGSTMLKEFEALLKAETDIFIIDTARGDSEPMMNALIEIRREFGDGPLIMAGNVDTPDGTKMLLDAGADIIKVGIGGGAACKTRRGPGVGIPQITAIAWCAPVAKKYGKTVISDGGIKGPSDYCKALVAGASGVMIGGMFAATDETPGEIFFEDGKEWKFFRGSASLEFQKARQDRGAQELIRQPEGISRREPYKGSVTKVVESLYANQWSSMSYVGAATMDEFHQKGMFLWQTPSGFEEGKPHEVS